MNESASRRGTCFVLVFLSVACGAACGEELVDESNVRIIKGRGEALAFTPDSKSLLSSEQTDIKVFDLATGSVVRTLKGHTSSVKALALTGDGKRLLSGGTDRSVKIWNLANAAAPASIPNEGKFVFTVALSPNEKLFAAGGKGKTLRIWDFPAGKLRSAVEAHPRDVRCVAFSPDSKMLASCGFDSVIELWEAETGRAIGYIENPPVQFHWLAVAFSPNGKSLAMSGSGLRVLDRDSGQEVFNVRSDKELTASFSWSPDGKLIATGGTDQLLKVWDATTGKQLAALPGHNSHIQIVRFSPDGRWIATATQSGALEIRLWPLVAPAAPK